MYIDQNSDIDSEALRTHTLRQLQIQKEIASQLFSDQHTLFWNKVHDSIVTADLSTEETKKYLSLEDQLHNLVQYIDRWIHTSVDSPERFHFFVAAKAEEIRSGNADKDYFWALQIRHDQLIAVVRVISRLHESIEEWFKRAPSEVISDPIFQGLLDYNVEDQIYLEAENTHKARARHML